MSATTIMMRDLRAEAAVEPPPVSTSKVTKETQIIAIYGRAASARASRWPTSAT
jgi:chlorophyllide a reductase subunit X